MLAIERSLKEAPERPGTKLWPRYELMKDRLLTVEYAQVMSGFPGGNDHGPQHILRVMAHLDHVLAPDPTAHLNPYELFLAMMAVLYHDVGILRGRKDRRSSRSSRMPFG